VREALVILPGASLFSPALGIDESPRNFVVKKKNLSENPTYEE
jgi:hypothetical protein